MRSYPNRSFLLLFGSDPVGIDTTTIGGGGESIESDPDPEPEPEPDAEATSPSSSSPFSACCSEGPDDFSRPFPPYPVTSVHSTSPEHAPSNDVDVDDFDDDDDDNDADIRASVIRDVKRL